MLSAATLLLSGNITVALASLLRAILLARLLTLEDFGIAATFSIAMNAMTMAFGFSLGQLAIQARDAAGARMQAGLQGLQAIIGGMLCVAVLTLAAPYADLMGTSEVASAYRWLALVPLCVGLVHFDLFRQQRRNHFGTFAAYTSLPVLVSLIAIWPLFVALGDWRVMPAALIIQAVTALALSHLRSHRRYRLTFDPTVVRRGLLFGAPLLGNAALVFAIFTGDRIIVAAAFDPGVLAWFSAAFMLTLMPANLALRTLNSLSLPRLSRDAEAGRDPAQAIRETCRNYALTAALLAVAITLIGGPVLRIAFGPAYAQAVPILTLLAVMQALRCARGAVDVLALSRARTGIILRMSVIRAIVIPLAAFAVLHFELALPWLIGAGIGGEVAALLLGLTLLHRRLALPMSVAIAPALGLSVTLLAIMMVTYHPVLAVTPAMRALPALTLLAALLIPKLTVGLRPRRGVRP
ncbi:oligosaccharide flippase family protein [Pseudooceanicola sp.]|uniref:oligosaccharide flippase family protein n=1 Tax=Pseudooceanicola sp. TaxID=1914328 RepID=UPI004059B4AE